MELSMSAASSSGSGERRSFRGRVIIHSTKSEGIMMSPRENA